MLRGSYIIIGVNALFLLGLAVTYSMAVYAGHVKFLWCFISYTGNYPLESCIFSAVLNACSAMYFLVVILRYGQISKVLEDSESRLGEGVSLRMKKGNLASAVFGSLGSLGLSMTGSFQQRTFYLMHTLGVSICIFCTNCYFIFQTYFSFTVLSGRTRTFLKVFRLIVVVLSTAGLAIGMVLLLYARISQLPNKPRRLLTAAPTPDVKSDTYRAISVIEWLIFGFFQLFIYSFGWDFKKIGLKRNQLIFME